MGELHPPCPSCGAETEDHGTYLETQHHLDCTWMGDPESKPYDEHPTYKVVDDEG